MRALWYLADPGVTDVGGWQALIVAVVLLVAIATIMTVAILKYPADQLVKIWGLMGTLTGVATGYFGQLLLHPAADPRGPAAGGTSRPVGRVGTGLGGFLRGGRPEKIDRFRPTGIIAELRHIPRNRSRSAWHASSLRRFRKSIPAA